MTGFRWATFPCSSVNFLYQKFEYSAYHFVWNYEHCNASDFEDDFSTILIDATGDPSLAGGQFDNVLILQTITKDLNIYLCNADFLTVSVREDIPLEL